MATLKMDLNNEIEKLTESMNSILKLENVKTDFKLKRIENKMMFTSLWSVRFALTQMVENNWSLSQLKKYLKESPSFNAMPNSLYRISVRAFVEEYLKTIK